MTVWVPSVYGWCWVQCQGAKQDKGKHFCAVGQGFGSETDSCPFVENPALWRLSPQLLLKSLKQAKAEDPDWGHNDAPGGDWYITLILCSLICQALFQAHKCLICHTPFLSRSAITNPHPLPIGGHQSIEWQPHASNCSPIRKANSRVDMNPWLLSWLLLNPEAENYTNPQVLGLKSKIGYNKV